MTRYILLILFCLAADLSIGQTQMQLNQEAKNNYQKSEKQINSVYQEILKKYKEDNVFIKNLRVAQRLWIQFRDAEMKAMFPEKESYYGTAQPMCWYNYIAGLTNERITKLRTWLDGTPEGDVCSGSIKIKN